MSLEEIDVIPDMSPKFWAFRYHLRDLWEIKKEGRCSTVDLSKQTATRIKSDLIPVANKQEKANLRNIIKALRTEVSTLYEYDRVMKKILG